RQALGGRTMRVGGIAAAQRTVGVFSMVGLQAFRHSAFFMWGGFFQKPLHPSRVLPTPPRVLVGFFPWVPGGPLPRGIARVAPRGPTVRVKRRLLLGRQRRNRRRLQSGGPQSRLGSGSAGRPRASRWCGRGSDGGGSDGGR